MFKFRCIGGYPRKYLDPRYATWHEEKCWELKFQRIGSIENIKSIEIVIYAPDKRKSDLTNKAESIMDLLVDNKIIEDDNWFEIPFITLKFGGVDRGDPRAEIVIYHDKNSNTI